MRLMHQLRPGAIGLIAALALAACGGESAPTTTPASAPTPAPVQSTPEPAPAPTTSTDSDAGASDETDAAAVVEAAAAATDDAAATAEPEASTTVSETPKVESTTPAAMPEGPEPRIGVDYVVIDSPLTMTNVPGKVEIAEVFSYTCIHCARLDPLIPGWRATLPDTVNFIQVPMAHGAFEPVARGFYAAQAMGVLEQTHRAVFKAVAEDHKLGSGKIDEVARIYADLGIDAQTLKATASSFAVNTQISRNQRTVARWGIEGTPTLVVAGKYRVSATADRGHNGMLESARWLALRELAQQHDGD